MTFFLFNLWTFVMIGRPQDLFAGLAVLRPALVLAGLTLMFMLFGSKKKIFNAMSETPEARKYLMFFAAMIISIPFAYHRRVAFEYVFAFYLMNVLFFLAFVTLVDSIEKLKKIILVITSCTVFYGVFGLLRGSFAKDRFAIYGEMFDPNDVAYVLVTLLPFSLFFVVRPEGLLRKLLAATGVFASLIVILLTGSRTGLLGLGVVLLMLLFSNAGSVKAFYKIGLVVGILTVATLNLDRLNVDRYLTLADIGQDYNVTSETGRLEIWKRGLELFLNNPISGVGVRCFPMAIGYLRADASAIPEWQAAHNSYLQIAVETGIIGFAMFVSIIACCASNFSRCRRVKNDTGVTVDEFKDMAGFFELSFTGHLVCAFFLSQGYSLFFTLFFSLSAVMRRLAPAVSDGRETVGAVDMKQNLQFYGREPLLTNR